MKELSVVVVGDGRWARALTTLLTNNQNRQRGHIKRVMHCTPPRVATGNRPAKAPRPAKPDTENPVAAMIKANEAFTGTPVSFNPVRAALKADSDDATMMTMTRETFANWPGVPPSNLDTSAVKADSDDETLVGIAPAAFPGLASSLPDRLPQDSVTAGSDDDTMVGLPASAISGRLGLEPMPSIELQELSTADVILLTSPSAGVRGLLRAIRPYLRPQQMIIHCIDGICPGDPSTEQPPMLPSAVIRQETPLTRIGALAGPVHPEDLEEYNPAAVICGSASEIVVAAARQILCCTTLRVYGSNDLIGVEVARAMSSVIALASGVCDVLEFGAASRATLVSRSAAESARLGMALGGQERTFLGLAGFGGFMLASERRGSYDFELGRLIGASIRLAEAQPQIGRTCDSVETVRDVHSLAESHGLRTPILTTIHGLLFSDEEVPTLVRGLLEDPTAVE